MAVDAAHGRLLVLDPQAAAIFTVDMATGVRGILSSSSTPNALNPLTLSYSMAVDAARNRALVVQFNTFSILAVDLTTGARTVFTTESMPVSPVPLGTPGQIVVDAAGDRAFVFDQYRRDVLSVSLATGARTLVSANEAGPGRPLYVPRGIALDSSRRLLFVIDGHPSIVSVDLATSSRSVLSDNSTPNGSNPFGSLGGIDLDATTGRLFVTNTNPPQAVVSVNLANGARTIVSSNTVPDATNSFVTPTDPGLDAAANRLVLIDAAQGSLLGVSLANGSRTVLSVGLTNPTDLDLDLARGRAFVSQFISTGIQAVDLATGMRSNFSTVSSVQALALDLPRNRAIGVHSSAEYERLFAVDLSTGIDSPIGVVPNAHAINQLESTNGLAVDSTAQIAFAANLGLNAVLAVDLVTGERVFVAR
jgi:hypothetical protein